MCCEKCYKYKKCEIYDSLKDRCCSRCAEHSECEEIDDFEEEFPSGIVDDDNEYYG